MDFRTLLTSNGFDLAQVSCCLHKPNDPIKRRAIAIAAEERPELFEKYHCYFAAGQEATVRARDYVASFVMTNPGELIFVGLYRREIGPICNSEEFLADPVFREMQQFMEGHLGPPERIATDLDGRIRFTLHRLEALADVSGRLVVADPGARNYMRLADTTPLRVMEVSRTGRISPPMPRWDELVMNDLELSTIPREWSLRLGDWRGVYLIIDESDGDRYVGSASGQDNLLGRWRQHAAGEHGITRSLERRNPRNFRFSILQLFHHDHDREAVLSTEANWKLRLHTREHGLNEN